MDARDVAADILTHLIPPGAVVVPSMVATLAVLQKRFGYTYITVQSWASCITFTAEMIRDLAHNAAGSPCA